MVQKDKRFKPYKVNVKGLSRRDAAKKRRMAYMKWSLFQDLKDTYKEEISSSEKTYVKNITKYLLQVSLSKIGNLLIIDQEEIIEVI